VFSPGDSSHSADSVFLDVGFQRRQSSSLVTRSETDTNPFHIVLVASEPSPSSVLDLRHYVITLVHRCAPYPIVRDLVPVPRISFQT